MKSIFSLLAWVLIASWGLMMPGQALAVSRTPLNSPTVLKTVQNDQTGFEKALPANWDSWFTGLSLMCLACLILLGLVGSVMSLLWVFTIGITGFGFAAMCFTLFRRKGRQQAQRSQKLLNMNLFLTALGSGLLAFLDRLFR